MLLISRTQTIEFINEQLAESEDVMLFGKTKTAENWLVPLSFLVVFVLSLCLWNPSWGSPVPLIALIVVAIAFGGTSLMHPENESRWYVLTNLRLFSVDADGTIVNVAKRSEVQKVQSMGNQVKLFTKWSGEPITISPVLESVTKPNCSAEPHALEEQED
jgi:hypothetical protein